MIAAALVFLSLCVSPAGAGVERDPLPTRGRTDLPARSRTDLPATADFRLARLGPGSHLRGYVGPESLDPTKGYLAAGYDRTGFHRRDLAYAGLRQGIRADGSRVRTYCFDLAHPARDRMAYRFGTWGEAKVPNTGYVSRIIHNYYPNTNQPAGLTAGGRAAAVQAAIWFFSDRYVLDGRDPLFPATSGIVSRVLKDGPMTEPTRPGVAISGPEHIRAGAVSGPFTINTTADKETVRLTGGEMFLDAAGTRPMTAGAAMRTGAPFYVRSASPGHLRMSATASITYPVGQAAAYVRDVAGQPNFPERGQKIILAQEDCVPVTVLRDIVVDVPQPVLAPVPPAPVPVPVPAPVPVPVVHRPSITEEKTVRPGTYHRAGQILHFRIRVTNNGDVPLDRVSVEDHMRGLSAVRCPRTDLMAGQSMVCTANYRITMRDLMRKSVRNCAVARGRNAATGVYVTSRRECARSYGNVPVTG
ncbi:thioester domain-containing protein [Spirillospora sp. NPDC052269]